ncbi:hypothetical protein AMJ52_04975 [candidate division TA06 bacterium DG_78]|uniref:Uncharacterized protein n=1 Tax=candidate division TA06 bacterium DG_78 TaxID=1703772 RepID=A0A0S7YDK3_UNCT6|nr:MAG: hypothetical protein AMJ52_04975 [candidate division TA06 bacterium DG_78]
MKQLFLITVFTALLVVQCATEEEEIYFTHLYGYAREETDSTTGISGLILKIRDLNPNDLDYWRTREVTTQTQDALVGFFEIDSVVYGTSQQQGTGYVAIFLDSLQNPQWPSQLWYPTIFGPADTIILYVLE